MHRDTLVLGLYASDLGRRSSRVHYRGTPDFDRPFDFGMERPRPYVGGQGPDLIVNLSNLLPPPYDPVLIGDLSSISSMRAILFSKVYVIRLQKIQTLYYSFSSDLG